MKRVMVLTVVLFVLSLGGFALVSAWMCSTQEKVEFTNLVARGDASVAEGLELTEYDLLENRVLWTTKHDLGAESHETKITYFGKEYQGFASPSFSKYFIRTLVPGGYKMEEYLRQESGENADGEVIVDLPEFTDYYDLCLASSGGEVMLTEYEQKNVEYALDFPYLKIPAEKGDCISLYVTSSGESLEYIKGYTGIRNRFQSYGEMVPAGTVISVGFAPNVQAKKEWAKDGFGLWLVSGATTEQPKIKVELVYPLDIEKQRVVNLAASPDRKQLLLFLVEDGMLKLQVLRSDSFTLEQSISLGSIGVQKSEETYPGRNEQDITQEIAEYDSVLIHKGQDFYAVAVGKRLVVLQNKGGVLELQFTCDMPDLRAITDGDSVESVKYSWEDQQQDTDDSQHFKVSNPSGFWEFNGLAMALRDGKLAVAWSDKDSTVMDGTILVEIYSAKGLEYARLICCELYYKNGCTTNFDSWLQPELNWAG